MEIITIKDKNSEEYKLTITPKVESGFLKVNYMQNSSHHNENFKYFYLITIIQNFTL